MPQSLFNEAAGLYPSTSLNERTPTQVFSNESFEIFKTPFFTEHLKATASVLQKNILPIK